MLNSLVDNYIIRTCRVRFNKTLRTHGQQTQDMIIPPGFQGEYENEWHENIPREEDNIRVERQNKCQPLSRVIFP